ncbi:MAG TPA: hypothetical protein VHB73_00135 [Alphaproteobacteria bacterium]|nr:hypothetical protein [Alphaproteobacteria bacterium]
MSAKVLIFSFASLCMLGACSNDELPKWLTGEPTQTEINAAQGPVALPPPPSPDQPYPNLADVPPSPRPQLQAPQRADEVNNLKKENVEGQAAVQQFSDQIKASSVGPKK